MRATGFYIQGAVHLCRKFQGVVKFEDFNPDSSVRTKYDLRRTTLGLNWFVRQDLIRLGADYVIKQGAVDSSPNNAVLVQFQYFLH